MKKALSYSVAAILVIALLYSCQKDNDGPKQPAERILGIWNIIREIEVMKDNSGNYADTAFDIDIAPGVFTADFRNNGKLYTTIIQASTTRDTVSYQVHSESHMVIDGDDYDINTFTDAHMIATNYYFDGSDSVKHVLEFKK